VKNVEEFVREEVLKSGNKYDIIHGGATAQMSQIRDILELLNDGGVMIFPYRADHLWIEELASWSKDENGKTTGPISIAPGMYTPLVKSNYNSDNEESEETET
jgi:protein-L-isoaspartate O-methyltransferase